MTAWINPGRIIGPGINELGKAVIFCLVQLLQRRNALNHTHPYKISPSQQEKKYINIPKLLGYKVHYVVISKSW